MRTSLLTMPRGMRLLIVTLAIVSLTGCGEPATVISGVVMLDGQPVPRATLEFFPVSGRGKVSFTKSDEQGRYLADVSPTKQAVVITAMKVVGKAKNLMAPDGPPVDALESILPEQYSDRGKTPLTADPVEGKTTTIDFALTSSEK
jgi:hypothetical protein